MVQTDVEIRERRPDELPVEVEIHNAAHPPDADATVEEVQRWEAFEEADTFPLRLLAFVDGRPTGSGGTFHGWFDRDGHFSIGVSVRPEYRRRGIGRALYERLAAHAIGHGARELGTFVHEHNLPLVETWLASEGFQEVERMRKSELRLDALDLDDFAEAEERVTGGGIALTTLADEDTVENRRRLWALNNLTERDVPTSEPNPEEPFDKFEETINRPQVLRDCVVIARDGERHVGFTILAHEREGRAFTWMTGVDPEYRGRGIALAMKVRCARLARQRGYTSMQTFNHVNNPAMLAVNTRLGYRPLPESVIFRKKL